jgi:hypothetical protein
MQKMKRKRQGRTRAWYNKISSRLCLIQHGQLQIVLDTTRSAPRSCLIQHGQLQIVLDTTRSAPDRAWYNTVSSRSLILFTIACPPSSNPILHKMSPVLHSEKQWHPLWTSTEYIRKGLCYESLILQRRCSDRVPVHDLECKCTQYHDVPVAYLWNDTQNSLWRQVIYVA